MLRYNEHAGQFQESIQEIEDEVSSHISLSKQIRYDPEHYKMHQRYISRLEDQAASAKERMESMTPELESEQQKVTEARKKKRIVELLKEKRQAEYNHETRRLEAKELEESAMLRHSNPLKDPFETRGHYEKEDKFSDEYRDEQTPDIYAGENELPEEKRDYVKEYFERVGMDYPDKKKR